MGSRNKERGNVIRKITSPASPPCKYSSLESLIFIVSHRPSEFSVIAPNTEHQIPQSHNHPTRNKTAVGTQQYQRLASTKFDYKRPGPHSGKDLILSDVLIHPKASDGSSSMVVFVDLDRDAFTEHPGSTLPLGKPFPPKLMVPPIASTDTASQDFPPSPTSSDDDRPSSSAAADAIQIRCNPNRNAFSAALSCYPYVVGLENRHPTFIFCR